jgi:oligopeptide transport system substrate-binding protein
MLPIRGITRSISCLSLFFAGICYAAPWNYPHMASSKNHILFSSFASPPKTLDPAQAYSTDSYTFIGQIYEPPLQYDYLKRPYQLVPLSASSLPEVTYLDANKQPITAERDTPIAYTRYDITIKPKQYYQPHPAFAINPDGSLRYHHLTPEQLANIHSLDDFDSTGSRPVTAADYVYEIKRLVSPIVQSPIAGIMEEHIEGLRAYRERLDAQWKTTHTVDLAAADISGVEVVDSTHYQITLVGQYPQFMYWLAMPFFAPVAHEVDHFYQQAGMAEKNLTLAWHPVGSGPFMLSKNNPNSVMILDKNPNFHGEAFPQPAADDPTLQPFLALAGKPLPLIDRAVFNLEKENIPYWYKFLQGYYDRSTISSDNFDQAIQISPTGDMERTAVIAEEDITLETSTNPSIFYLGFNMADTVIGGDNDRHRALRQAISIAIDYEEYVNIFLNGRGTVAHSPLPPGIFGAEIPQAHHNPYVYNEDHGNLTRKSITDAQNLLKQAGYPHGIDPRTGQPLVLYLDSVGTGPNAKAQTNWYRKQLAKLGIDLYVRNTSWNRFQEKLRTGTTQLFTLGWNADYPDPENFFFLLYGPNSKLTSQGENVSNFHNHEYDSLFETMKDLPNGPERAAVIAKMVAILQKESPWVWGFFPKTVILNQSWVGPRQDNPMAINTLKYASIDGALRHQKQQQWNQPQARALGGIIGVLLIILIPAIWTYQRKNQRNQCQRYR